MYENGVLLCSTCNHSWESHTCKFFTFPSAVKAKDEYKQWIHQIKLFTVFIENLSFWKECKIQQFDWMCYFHQLKILWKFMIIACKQFMIAFVLCITVPGFCFCFTLALPCIVNWNGAWIELLQWHHTLFSPCASRYFWGSEFLGHVIIKYFSHQPRI